MSHRLIAAAVSGILAAVPLAAPAAADEVSELRAQLEAIQKRLADLEKQQAEAAEAQERTTDTLAKTRAGVGEWVGRFQWKGDFRYRNETIDQEFASSERNRDRIRLRGGFVAKVNNTVKTEVQMTTTEGADPRSSNQTLTGSNSRKSLDLDLAYAEWAPNALWKLTLGKQKYPWVRPGQSMFFDGDVNPEGVAWSFSRSGFFGGLWYTNLAERGAFADSNMAGGQLGYRWDISATNKLTLGVSYFGHNAVQGYDPLFGNDPFGNTAVFVTQSSAGVVTNRDICRAPVATPARPATGTASSNTRCLVSDYDIVELLAEFTTALGGRPLTVFADFAMNEGAEDLLATAQVNESDLDTAFSVGFGYGKAGNPRTWELGLVYQSIEKDALFGQWIDSDFGGGNTDAEGLAFKFGYAFSKNFAFNGTYLLNETNIDVPTTIAGVPVTDREYKRLQLDVNFKF